MSNPLTPRQRLVLIDLVNALLKPDFERLIYAIAAPSYLLPSNFAAQGDRAPALLAWVESSEGCSLKELLGLLEEIAPKTFRAALGNDSDLGKDTTASNLTLHRYKRINKGYTEDLGNGVMLTLMLIPAGEFLMGAPENEPDSRANERPQCQVIVSRFFMGRYPVTQAQWRVVAGYKLIDRELRPEPSSLKGNNRPVENVSWDDAMEFCKRLSTKTGKNYRLPSEAQWEYACRAGTETPFYFGERLTLELSNSYWPDSEMPEGQRRGTTEVRRFPANNWGLYDMHGNVWEWCEDGYNSGRDASGNSHAWVETDHTKTRRLLRGGSWLGSPEYCRSAYRNYNSHDYSSIDVGFRVCCVSSGVSS